MHFSIRVNKSLLIILFKLDELGTKMAQSEQTQPETELPLRTWLISIKTKRYNGERFFGDLC